MNSGKVKIPAFGARQGSAQSQLATLCISLVHHNLSFLICKLGIPRISGGGRVRPEVPGERARAACGARTSTGVAGGCLLQPAWLGSVSIGGAGASTAPVGTLAATPGSFQAHSPCPHRNCPPAGTATMCTEKTTSV